MKKNIECVPNFSEGRDPEKIKKIADEIRKVKGVELLDIKSDSDHNRTVITFAGEPLAVKKATFSAIAKAAELIDMSSHKGAHPRMGATDVCPFVPLKGATMKDCVKLAGELAGKVGRELGIPVYLYEEAARDPERRNLEDIRRGEYEGLAAKLKSRKWKPDCGPAGFNKKSGATVIGAREFLIAFNINLQSRDVELAKGIAGLIRQSGRVKTGKTGKIRISGIFKFVKAIAVDLKKRDSVQVSMNLTNYKLTPMHAVFEIVRGMAELAGTKVIGGEIVGLIPEEALLMAGKFYAPDVRDKEALIRIAANEMLLNKSGRFEFGKKIIERMLK